MTGLPRWAIVIGSLVVALVSMVAILVLLGVASLCGVDENQVETGYCAAGRVSQTLVVAIPASTIVAGYGASVWLARLTPVVIAGMCALVEGVVLLWVGL
jgi:hypothetical protein